MYTEEQMIDFSKNFIALGISTLTWMAGLGGVFGVIAGVFTLDIIVLIVAGCSFLIMGAGIILARYNKRIKTALEFPFGFLLG